MRDRSKSFEFAVFPDDQPIIRTISARNQNSLRSLQRLQVRIKAWENRNWSKKMTYEQPQYEIEKSVLALGLAYAASLISLIVWMAC